MIITRNTFFSLIERPDILAEIPEMGFLVEEGRQRRLNAKKPADCGKPCAQSQGRNVDFASRGLSTIAGLPAERIQRLRIMLGDQHLYLYQGQPPVLIELGAGI